MSRTVRSFIVAAIIALLGASSALADCSYNGKRVSEGTRVGAVVCENGKWVQKR